MGIIKFWNRGKEGYCNRCGRRLTDEEKEYYIMHCEKCEGKLWNKINKEDFKINRKKR